MAFACSLTKPYVNELCSGETINEQVKSTERTCACGFLAVVCRMVQ